MKMVLSNMILIVAAVVGRSAGLEPSRVSCNAAYSAPCSRTNSEWLATSTALALQEIDDQGGVRPEEYFVDVTNGMYNYNEGFYPFIFDAETGVCLAHGANPVLVGLTLSEIFGKLHIGYADTNALLERFVAAAEKGGDWVQYLWHDGGSTNSKMAFVTGGLSSHTNTKYFLGVGYEDVQLPPSLPCSAGWDAWCSHTNVRSLVGAAQFRLNQADSLPTFESTIFDLSFEEGLHNKIPSGFYTFMYSYSGQLKSHAVLRDSFGLDLGEIFVKNELGTREEGLRLHDDFVAAAEGLDSGWVQYEWRNSLDEPTYTKIAFVVKITFGDEDYYLGAGYNFVLDEILPGPLGEDCPASYNPPCAFKTTLQLTSHTASYAISSPESPEDVFRSITEDPRFKIGEFYVFLYEFETARCRAHGSNAAFVGKTLPEIFQEINISLNATRLHEQFRAAAENGGGWIEYDWVVPGVDGSRFKKVSYLFRINLDGVDYYAGVGFNHKRIPVELDADYGFKKNGSPIPCSSRFGLDCSETISQAILGEAMTALTLASTASAQSETKDNGQELEAVLSRISNKDVAFTVNDFHVAVFAVPGSEICVVDDGSGCCIAHGGNASFVGQTWQQILDANEITTIKGVALHNQLVAASAHGAGSTLYSWSGPSGGMAQTKHAWVSQFQNNDTSHYVISEYLTTEMQRTCDQCPSGWECTFGEQEFCTEEPSPSIWENPGIIFMLVLLAVGVPFLVLYFRWRKKLSKERAREKIKKLEQEKSRLAKKLDDKLVGIVEIKSDLLVRSPDNYQEFLTNKENIDHLRKNTGKWFWEEEAYLVGDHQSSFVLEGTNYIQYLEEISDQIEHAYQLWKEGGGFRYFHVDLTNKIVKVSNQNTGAEYEVDFVDMVQRNARTKFERQVQRAESEEMRVDNADLLPSLPENIEFAGDQAENLLPLFTGQIIQVSHMHPDEQWLFGTVIYDPLLNEAIEQEDRVDQTKRMAELTAMALLDRPTSGWFPKVLSKPADMGVMKKLLIEIGSDGLSSIATPKDWTEDDEGLLQVQNGTEEYDEVEAFFKKKLYFQRDEVDVVGVERVQNLPLFQSYEVKKETMKRRNIQKPENLVHNPYPDKVECRWLFHGTIPDVVPKIVQQGFNRAFSGRNAVVYGNGVYFARDASYSSHTAYSAKDSKGIQRMFLCRVAVGDWCKGNPGQLTPDTKPHSHVELFDTTVDNVSNPSIFVVYHDAQAYPEYLVSFKRR